MNCAECQTDPLTPGHYCPCCGRKLSLEEQRAIGGTVPAHAPVRASAIVTEPSHDSTPAVAQQPAAFEATPQVQLPALDFDLDEIKRAKAKEAADLIAQAHLAKAANPTPVVRRPVVAVPPPPPKQSRAPMLMMAAAVIVGAIGAVEGARRLGFEWPGQDAREAPPVQTAAVAADVTPPARRAIAPETPSVAEGVPPTRVAPETNPAPETKPKAVRPAAKPKAAAAEKRPPVRQASPSVQDVPVVARNSSPEKPAPAPARPAVSESARPSAPPSGRFFEPNDVDAPPRVASRVAPRLPANLPAGADKKIAVARVLVSRTGHPYQVTLLRGSTLGRASDDAVVAAVMQWTFSPATKRGEPVNCWYNIGVPLGHAD